jgi:TatD DNase family protein
LRIDIRSRDLSYVDAHLHLADPGYAAKIETIMQDATKNSVTRLLSNAVDYNTSVETIAFVKQYEGRVFAAVGVHPWAVLHDPSMDLNRFEHLIDENRAHVRAIGEIGLDGKYTQDAGERGRQREVFKFFLKLATQRQLPVVVHSRLAVDDVSSELALFDSLKVMLHWYDGPVENLELIKSRGYMISIGPSLLYSKRIAEIAREADLNMILTETDGPVTYHGPFEGRMTQPSFVIDVIRKLAEIRSEKFETVRDRIWGNFERFFAS